MPTTELASTPASRSQEPMPKLCQDNGNSKSDPAKVLKLETTSGLLDSSLAELLRTSTFQSHSLLSSSKIGTVLDAILTTPPRL